VAKINGWFDRLITYLIYQKAHAGIGPKRLDLSAGLGTMEVNAAFKK